MAALTLELPFCQAQTVFNLRRWSELLAAPELNRLEGRVETDCHGRIIMSLFFVLKHGSLQSEIAFQFRSFILRGWVLTECLVSTADGVKAVDVVWVSFERMQVLGDQTCFIVAPEICIEVLSSGNTDAEI